MLNGRAARAKSKHFSLKFIRACLRADSILKANAIFEH